MKLPNWIVVDGIKPSDINADRTMTVRYTIRFWHPGFWVFVLRTLAEKWVGR